MLLLVAVKPVPLLLMSVSVALLVCVIGAVVVPMLLLSTVIEAALTIIRSDAAPAKVVVI